jgi:hypothetical protein
MAGQRRIDRVTDPELPGRIGDMQTAAIRSLRDDCREEESRLSYTRRLLQARLDIARAEVARRGGADEQLLGRLPQILSEHGGVTGNPRSLRIYHPDEVDPHRRLEDRELEDPALSRLPQLADDALDALISRLSKLERQVSDERARVLNHLDSLQGELVARYRDGRATIGEVLSSNAEG